jgi:glycosyltransferase involved in cell wall biosynthesis
MINPTEDLIFVFSIIIPTHDSERALVPTLAALFPGVMAGVVREVIVADGGSTDETEQVADIAGCRFIASTEPLGARLKAASASVRGTWLMFLRAGAVPGANWVDEVIAFVEQSGLRDQQHAAAFAAGGGPFTAALRRLPGLLPSPSQGVIIAKSLYDSLGGHRGAAAEAETDLLRRIGRRRLITLRTKVNMTDI